MTSPISNITNVTNSRPAIAWLVSRFPVLDPWSRTEGDAEGGVGERSLRAPAAPPGVAQGPAATGPSHLNPRTDAGFRGWIEDWLLTELGDRLMASTLRGGLPGGHISDVRTAILQLNGTATHAEAVRVLKNAEAIHDALQQGRHALQEV
jgi:hypothetical protein